MTTKRSPDIEKQQQQENDDEEDENITPTKPLLNNSNNSNNGNNSDNSNSNSLSNNISYDSNINNLKNSKTTIIKSNNNNDGDNNNNSNNEIFVNLNPHNENLSKNNIILNNSMNHSYENNIIYRTEGPFNERIPIMVKNPASPNLPLTFYRGLWVIILVVVFLVLSTLYFIEYRFLDTNIHTGTDKRNTVHYLFIITRPLVLVPLLFIIPLYGLNDKKTRKYSLFIAIALVLNIIGDCIYSIQINFSSTSGSSGNNSNNNSGISNSDNSHTSQDDGSSDKNQLLYSEFLYLFSFIFYLLSRLLYTIAFIVGIGKKIKPRLFHSIPFYVYSAALILLIVFSKSIAPYMHRNSFSPLPSINLYYDKSLIIKSSIINNNNHDINNNDNGINLLVNQKLEYINNIDLNNLLNFNNQEYQQQYINSDNSISVSLKSSSADSTSSSSELEDIDPVHFVLICLYGFIEATMVWRALSLTSSFPGTNPSRMLLWFCVLGATTFGIVDTLLVIDNYYHPIQPIFYLSNALNWLASSLIVFSIPRRLEIRDYIYKVFRLNRRGFRIISNSMAFNNKITSSQTSNINS